YIDYLPLKHKSGDMVLELPQSLKDALYQYVIARGIRVLDGEGHKHSSMLVNVSRFNAIQKQVHDLLYVLLQDVTAAVDAWASSSAWSSSATIVRLYNIWLAEFSSQVGFSWDEIRSALKRGLAPIEVKLVNMKGGGLDYNKPPASGIHVIAVGGLALARGLTLEGLIISYVLRNVGAADTLLQMGRWFGYRDGYAKICRIHATEEMLGDFREVSEAVEELRNDLVRMERMKVTPNEFGLKVRQSPTGIAITAANKMRAAKSVVMAVDLSSRHLQAYELFNDKGTNQKHVSAIESLLGRLESEYSENRDFDNGALVWTRVSVSLIQDLLKRFELPQLEFAHGQGDSSLVLDYIADRASGELAYWDIAIPFRRTGEIGLDFPFKANEEEKVYCRNRKSGVPKSDDPDVVKITANHVVADAAEFDLPYGERPRIETLLSELKEKNPKASPEKLYLMARTRPLLLIHVIAFDLKEPTSKSLSSKKDLKFEKDVPVVSLSLAFPKTEISAKPREYFATRRLTELMQRQREELESDEDLDSDD
ncbi:Z1 domain-containing protein, partial [Pseudomonas protegens]|uniref:Z1 domain-containing protein n=3 Tax=Pseudomonas protegens TaxID=380021 RepID=UPI001B33A4FD